MIRLLRFSFLPLSMQPASRTKKNWLLCFMSVFEQLGRRLKTKDVGDAGRKRGSYTGIGNGAILRISI